MLPTTSTPISPSALAVQALGMQPQGVPSPREGICAMCAAPIAVGDLFVRTEYGQNFTDDASLAARGSGMLCGHCATAKTVGSMRLMQKAVFTREGAYPLAKDIHRAWFLLTPPEPPFVAVVSNSMQQHLVWRTPVSWSKDLFHVRFGGHLFKIRRPVLLEALDACAKFMSSQPENAGKTGDAIRKHPYVLLSRDAEELTHGVLRSDLGPTPAILHRLTPGEVWALATLAKAKTPSPEKPQRLTADTQTAEESADE